MEKVSLAGGDFSLQSSDERTYLTANCPESSRQISKPGDAASWSREQWQEFLREAREFGRDDLIEALEELRNSVVKERIQDESPAFNDDANETPSAVHTLRVHHSREGNYVRVTGTSTQEHRGKLAELGLRWSPEDREWHAEFDEELLEAVEEYVVENDALHNPLEIGYIWCEDCSRFRPEEKACSCGS